MPAHPPPSPEATATPAWLDTALHHSLRPPQAPSGLRERLMRALQHEHLVDLSARHAALQAEHAQALARLRASQVSRSRQSLAGVVGLAFTAGALVVAGLPWWADFTGWDATTLLPALASLLGMSSGVVVGLGRWERWRWW